MDTRDNLTINDKNMYKFTLSDDTSGAQKHFDAITVESYGLSLAKGRRKFYFVVASKDVHDAPTELHAYLQNNDNSWAVANSFHMYFDRNRTALIAKIPQLNKCVTHGTGNSRIVFNRSFKIALNSELNTTELQQQCKYIVTLFQAMENSGHFHPPSAIEHRSKTKATTRFEPIIANFMQLLNLDEEKVATTTRSSTQTMLTSLATCSIEKKLDTVNKKRKFTTVYDATENQLPQLSRAAENVLNVFYPPMLTVSDSITLYKEAHHLEHQKFLLRKDPSYSLSGVTLFDRTHILEPMLACDKPLSKDEPMFSAWQI